MVNVGEAIYAAPSQMRNCCHELLVLKVIGLLASL
jgi:hypothetical protein